MLVSELYVSIACSALSTSRQPTELAECHMNTLNTLVFLEGVEIQRIRITYVSHGEEYVFHVYSTNAHGTMGSFTSKYIAHSVWTLTHQRTATVVRFNK